MEKLNIPRPTKVPPKRATGDNAVYDQVIDAVKKSITIPAPTVGNVMKEDTAKAAPVAKPVTTGETVVAQTAPAQPNTSAMTGAATQPSVNQAFRQPNIPVNPASQAQKAQKPPKAAPTPTYVFNFGSGNPFTVPATSAAQPAQQPI